IKIRGISSFAFDAATEGHTDQIAAEIVTPLMVNADVGIAIAAHLPTNEGAAMRAAIHESMQLTLAIAGNHDRRVANEGRFEVPRIREFGVEANIIPHRTTKDPLLFSRVNSGVNKHLIGNAGYPFLWPTK